MLMFVVMKDHIFVVWLTMFMCTLCHVIQLLARVLTMEQRLSRTGEGGGAEMEQGHAAAPNLLSKSELKTSTTSGGDKSIEQLWEIIRYTHTMRCGGCEHVPHWGCE